MPRCSVGTVTPMTGPMVLRMDLWLLDKILRFHGCLPHEEPLEVGNPYPSDPDPVSMEPC